MEGEQALGLAREGVESPETFQTHLDAFLCHQLQVTLPWQGVGLGALRRSLLGILGFWECTELSISEAPLDPAHIYLHSLRNFYKLHIL